MRVLQREDTGALILLTKINIAKGTFELQSGSLSMVFRVKPKVDILDYIRSQYTDLGPL